jgi:hypothetical protein
MSQKYWLVVAGGGEDHGNPEEQDRTVGIGNPISAVAIARTSTGKSLYRTTK